MTAYTLPTIPAVVGDFKIKLFHATAGLTAPTVDTILHVGKRKEVIETSLGKSALSTLELIVRDDYSTYSEGFWYKILSTSGDTTYIRMTLNDGNGDEFYFIGKIFDPESDWDVQYYDSSTNAYIRVAKLTLVDISYDLFNASTADWVTTIHANDVATGIVDVNKPSSVISLAGVFAALLKSSGLNASYSTSDISFVFDASNPNLKFTISATDYFVDDLFIAINFIGGTGLCSYFDSFGPHANYWDAYSSTAGQILGKILDNFGLAMRIDYDPSTESASALGTTKIQLIQVTRAFSGTISFSGREKKMAIKKNPPLLATTIIYSKVFDWDGINPGFDGAWLSKNFQSETIAIYYTADDTPEEFGEPAVLKEVFFNSANPALMADKANICQTLWVYNGATYVHIGSGALYYYNLRDSAWSGDMFSYIACLVGFDFFRLRRDYSAVLHTYGHMQADAGAGDTFTALSIGRRRAIHDGVGSANYYANEVTLDPMSSEVEIEWFKE
jgi:hypothetical protein